MIIWIACLTIINILFLGYAIYLFFRKKKSKRLSTVLILFAVLTLVWIVLVFQYFGGINRFLIGGFYKPAEETYVKVQDMLIEFKDPTPETLYFMLHSEDRVERFFAIIKISEVEDDAHRKISKVSAFLLDEDALWMGGKTKCLKCDEENRMLRMSDKAQKAIKILGADNIKRYLQANPNTSYKTQLYDIVRELKSERCEINSNRYFRADWEQLCKPASEDKEYLCVCTRYNQNGDVTETFNLMEKDALKRRKAKF